MYEKVSANLNFVEREKRQKNFGQTMISLEKVWKTVKKEKPIHL